MDPVIRVAHSRMTLKKNLSKCMDPVIRVAHSRMTLLRASLSNGLERLADGADKAQAVLRPVGSLDNLIPYDMQERAGKIKAI